MTRLHITLLTLVLTVTTTFGQSRTVVYDSSTRKMAPQDLDAKFDGITADDGITNNAVTANTVAVFGASKELKSAALVNLTFDGTTLTATGGGGTNGPSPLYELEGTNVVLDFATYFNYTLAVTNESWLTLTNAPGDDLADVAQIQLYLLSAQRITLTGSNLVTPGNVITFTAPAGSRKIYFDFVDATNYVTLDWLATTNTTSGAPTPGALVQTTNGSPVLATGTVGQVLTANADGTATFQAATGGGSASTNQAQVIFQDDDFLGGSAAGQGLGLLFVANSGSASSITSAETNRPGIIQCNTSTTTTAAPVYTGGSICFGSDTYTLRWVIRTPTALSDGTDPYHLVIGFGDSTSSTLPTDGAYFFYNHNTNSANWTGFTASNSLITAASGGSNVPLAISTWYDLVVTVNAAANSASFYVNGTLIGTSASNIPSGSNRTTNLQLQVVKESGTGVRILAADYISLSATLASARW